MKALLGTKIGMTQIISKDGVAIPVTLIQAGPVTVTQVKTVETDGYTAVQVAYGEGKNLSNAVSGHVKAAKVTPKVIREVRVGELGEHKVGDSFDVTVFAVGETVDVTGTSKGKGFAGVMKRHGFHGLRASHGVERKHRSPGSIGACATPGRVFKGIKMAGRMGSDRITTINLTVAKVDAENGLLLIKGAVPGPIGSLILVRSAAKNQVKAGKK